ncbi:hypothetical protein MMC07_007141 [Pseudocyphellaria aurata]|nr:hypothetical protein [Pseudocyphellaria aurata]
MNLHDLKLAQELTQSPSIPNSLATNPPTGAAESSDKAPQACLTCRAQKRKCDKALPSCGLCTRVKRVCNYSFEPSSSASSEQFQSLQRKVRRLEAQLDVFSAHGSPVSSYSWRSTSRTPASSLNEMGDAEQENQVTPMIFFLDRAAYLSGKYQIGRQYLQLPQVFEDFCPSTTIVQRIVASYFRSTHSWLPIVSKERMLRDLKVPLENTGADLALLCLCMRLVGERLPQALHNPQTSFYLAVKEYYFQVESAGLLSVQLLQAGILLAVYEFGHAIFPSSYVTIGRCAKIGQAMGINHGASPPQMLPPPTTWTEMEERSRVWWAVLLLDRQMTLGNTALPMSVQDPSQVDYLPSADAGWDQGGMGANEPLFLSSALNEPTGRYARLCQAGHLVGKIVQHVNNQFLNDEARFQEVIQLNRTLQAVSVVISNELDQESNMVLHSAMALCYSGMMILNKPYSGTESTGIFTGLVIPTEFQKHALNTLRLAARETSGFAASLHAHISDLVEQVSPLLAHCFYQAINTYGWFSREMPTNSEIPKAIEFLKETLRKLDRRWKIAGEKFCLL